MEEKVTKQGVLNEENEKIKCIVRRKSKIRYKPKEEEAEEKEQGKGKVHPKV